MQKMITKDLLKRAPSLYETEHQGNCAIAQAHYFSCYKGLASFDWYMTEYDPVSKTAFGLIRNRYGSGCNFELGYFSISEFEQMNQDRGFEVIERDISWKPCELSELMDPYA